MLGNETPYLVSNCHSYPSGAFSPDGQFLLITDSGARMLKRVPLTGGPATPIGEDPNRNADWGPDDTIVQGSDFVHPLEPPSIHL